MFLPEELTVFVPEDRMEILRIAVKKIAVKLDVNFVVLDHRILWRDLYLHRRRVWKMETIRTQKKSSEDSQKTSKGWAPSDLASPMLFFATHLERMLIFVQIKMIYR